MALTGKTIGQLNHLTSSLTGNEAFPIQYNGSTYHISQSQIVSGLATIGSNIFTAIQIITGSNGVLKYSGNAASVNPVYPTLEEIHANDSYPWLSRFYNDSYSTSNAVMAYFGWSDGRFVFHNESTESIGLQVNGFQAENGLLVYSDRVAFINNVTVAGNHTVTQNLYVQGTASINNIQYISQSSLNIGTNLITVNTATPTTRFGGLAVYDSGSTGTGLTGSMLWDSQNNTWIYSNPSGSSYDGAMVLMGPRNSSGIGNEVGITQYYVTIGDGSHHMTSSQIYNSGSLIRLETNTQITGSLNITGSITIAGTQTITGTISGSLPANNPSSSLILLSGSIRPTGSVSGSSVVLMNTVMSASNNNQTLVGMDIIPAFNAGAFTGITTIGLRILSGSLHLGGSITGRLTFEQFHIKASDATIASQATSVTSYSGLNMFDSSAVLGASFQYGNASAAQFANTFFFGPRNSTGKLQIVRGTTPTISQTMFANGNFLIQDGGTHTDNGYRLQINGAGAVSGSLWASGSVLMTGSLNISGSVTASSALISGPLTITGSNTVLFTSNIDTLTLTGSLLLSTGSMFGLPTTSSTTPVTGSMFWSGSLLFVWNGSRYMSASFV
jgi:cytoskeletal protein CcmA (bactofilin family)